MEGLAESCARYLSKGRKVAVHGCLQTRSYEDKEGKKRTAFEVIAGDVEFLSPAPGTPKADEPDGFAQHVGDLPF